MSRDRHFTRINLLDIKFQIGKKIGRQKAEKYFGLLNRYFRLKLAKSEFDKLCIATVGRENIALHNFLIRSILRNVSLAKAPPSKGSKSQRPVIADGYRRKCLQSPQMGLTPSFRDRRIKDRMSPLGPPGKHSAISSKDDSQKILEEQSATELRSLGSQPVDTNSVEDGEEVDQEDAISPGTLSRSPVTPPLGIPWNSKGNRKVVSAMSASGVRFDTCHGSGVLPDTGSLRKRLEQKLEKEGLRVSLDCATLLNNGLDVFLKRLITPSLELACSRLTNKQPTPIPILASMLDFRTAMEYSPQILGEDWPMQLEKVTLEHWDAN